jgi:hypothetical protein
MQQFLNPGIMDESIKRGQFRNFQISKLFCHIFFFAYLKISTTRKFAIIFKEDMPLSSLYGMYDTFGGVKGNSCCSEELDQLTEN